LEYLKTDFVQNRWPRTDRCKKLRAYF